MTGPFRPRNDGVDLFVRLTPKAAMDRLEGIEISADGRSHLKARVRAVPENGAANQALERLVAKALEVPRSAVSVVAGGTARLKTLRISGDPAALARCIEALGWRPKRAALIGLLGADLFAKTCHLPHKGEGYRRLKAKASLYDVPPALTPPHKGGLRWR